MNLRELDKFIELEIGFGRSCILFKLADIFPERYFIGVEIDGSCFRYNSKLKKYPNVNLIKGDIRDIIKDIPQNSIDRVHIYFPSPGPSMKRYFTKEFAEQLHHVIKKGGVVKLATDKFEYYIQIQSFLNSPLWTFITWDDLPFITNQHVLVDTACEHIYIAKYYMECKKN